jgi:hypothetical protein
MQERNAFVCSVLVALTVLKKERIKRFNPVGSRIQENCCVLKYLCEVYILVENSAAACGS